MEAATDVEQTLAGTQGAICVFGPRPPYSAVFCARATEVIVSAMKAHGLRRLVCLTGAMVGELPSNVSAPMRLLAWLFRHRLPRIAADRAAQENVVMASALEWTIVKPPRLTDGPKSGRARAGTTLRVGLPSRVSRHYLAAFMLEEMAAGRHLGQRVYVCA